MIEAVVVCLKWGSQGLRPKNNLLGFAIALCWLWAIDLSNLHAAEGARETLSFPDLGAISIDGLHSQAQTSDEQKPWLESATEAFLDASVITLMHEVALPTREPGDMVNNRSSVRLEYERHFLENYYFRFDSKGTVFYTNDHRAEAKERDLLGEMTVREAYLQYSSGSNSWKFGQQILIWGESDVGAITDVISPRNVSELFFISLEESRIGQLLFTWDRFTPMGDWSFFFAPDPQLNTYPDPGTAYFLDPFAGQARIDEDKDAGQEFGLRWKKTFGEVDLSLMAASLVDNDYVYLSRGLGADGLLEIDKDRRRYDMAGMAFSATHGDFLFTGELASKFSKPLTTSVLDIVERDLVEASLRGEYSLGKNGSHSVSLEVADSHVLDWDRSVLPTPEDNYSIVLGWNNTFFNDNLTVNLLSLYNTPYSNWQHSLYTTYKVNDRVSLKLDAFLMTVWDDRSDYYTFRHSNSMVFRVLYQF